MFKRILALLSFIGAAAWPWIWEFIRSPIYEQGSRMLTHLIESIPFEWTIHWAPSVILAGIGFILFWKTWPKKHLGSPIEIIFDPSNPNRKFWSIEPMRDEVGHQIPGSFWEYRTVIKNTSDKTLRNIKITVEAIGPMPTRPETSIFDINKKHLIDLDAHCEALAVLRRWFNPPIVAGMLSRGAYGPIKMTASADDVLPVTKHFRFDPELTPMVSEMPHATCQPTG